MLRPKKLIFSGILFLFLNLIPASGSENSEFKKIYKNADYICRVTMDFEIQTLDLITKSTATFRINNLSGGSCFALNFKGETLILTSAHVVTLTQEEKAKIIFETFKNIRPDGKIAIKIKKTAGFAKIYFKNNPDKEISAKPKNIDQTVDLATLAPDNPLILKNYKGINLEKEKEIEVTDKVMNISNPQDLEYVFTAGYIAKIDLSIDKNKQKHKYITTSPMVERGSSGSPLINESGNCIGIAKSAFFDYDLPFSVFIHLEDVNSYLNKIKK